MFSAIVSITAVCVALAISGWEPTETPLYPEESAGLILLKDDMDYVSGRLNAAYSLMTDITDWALFYGDKALTDFHYPHIQMCECSGSLVHQGTFYPSVEWRREGENPYYMQLVYQVFRQSPENILRITAAFGISTADHVTDKWSIGNSLFSKFSPSVTTPTRRRADWTKLAFDIRVLLLTAFFHLASIAFKHWYRHVNGKKLLAFRKSLDNSAVVLWGKGRERSDISNKCCHLLTKIHDQKLREKICTLIMMYNALYLARLERGNGDSPHNKELFAIEAVPVPDAAPVEPSKRRYRSSNPHGFSRSWYRIKAVQKSPSPR